jgi:hypothetical protein
MSAFHPLRTVAQNENVRVVTIMIASFLALAAAVPPTRPVDTTACAVMQKPQAFNRKIVRFRAGVLTDWHHGIALIHSGCGGGIQLESIDAVPPKQSRAFDEAVGTRLNPGFDRTAMATFTGRVSWKRQTERRWFDNPLKFEAHLIENVKVYPRKRH